MIDDDTNTLEIYQMIAANTAYAHCFSVSESPLRSLQKLKGQINTPEPFPRYILLDLSMDEMSGFEFLEQFERLIPYRWINTEVIAVSSSTREQDQQQALGYDSVAQFLNKPIPQETLRDLLRVSAGEESCVER